MVKIDQLANGTGPFAPLGEKIYDDYWMFYLTKDMARSEKRPCTNLKTYLEYKERGVDVLRAHKKEIDEQAKGETGNAGEESE